MFVAMFAAAARWIPFPEDQLARLDTSAVLTDRNGEPLRVKLAAGGFDCRPGYKPSPDHWIAKALVAAEDRRFWSHPGVDVLAIARALGQNLFFGRRISGASTISTQVIRLAEPRRRTLVTKAIEAFRALQMERRHGKREILGQYLDRAPFGGNIVGIEAAARRYFGKGAAQLSLAEAALLAGVPQSPSRLRPDRHPDRAKKRQAYVLERMEACGFITAPERAEALAQPLEARPGKYPFRAPHFCDLVGVPARAAADSSVRTTLDGDLQRLAEGILRRHLEGGLSDGGAVVVLEVKTGAVRALVGSPDYAARGAGQVNGAAAPRAAGSTLKPFAYALALDRGLVTPETVIPDVPMRFRDLDPRNFSLDYRGLVTVRDALVASLNLPAIEIERRAGQERFWATLRELGLATIDQPPEHYGLGLVLGNAEVRLLDLANAYACLARGGGWAPARFVESGKPPPTKPVFSPEACWLVSDMLSGEERAMDTTGHAADVRLPPMAWKTGTSAGLRDAWTVAWNPEYVIGVWVGNPDGSPSDELVGRKAATPIAWDLFRRLYPDNQGPWFARPAGVEERTACSVSGCAPGPHCEHRVAGWAIAKVSRHEVCPVHRGGPEDAWPAPVASFLARRAAPAPEEPAEAVRILAPARGSAFRWMPDLDVDAQRLALEAASDRAGEAIHWFVDDRLVGKSRPGEKLFWPLERGTHQIVCSTARGLSDRVEIAVE
ncbi:MAG TPA: penicillin-binding protein 1C [Verrucomicrobia bacterium]|nr:penicillin-binding protein 1C [Verrucomicrobiota bacterium]